MGETKSTANVNLVAISRVALVLVMALLLGSLLAQSVDAKKMPANGASIAKRVGAQRDLCEVGGGSFESKETAFGSTITTCTGGDGGAGTCVNTKQSTNCHRLARPTENVQTPPTGGVYEEPSAGGVTPVVAGGAVVNSRFASADSDDQDHETKANHGKAKKNKGGKRKK